MQTTQLLPLTLIAVLMFTVIGGISLFAHYYTLSGIKSKTVGDGQHGTARFATKNEMRRTYAHIPFTVEQWRQGQSLPTEQGLVVGSVGSTKDISAWTKRQLPKWIQSAIVCGFKPLAASVDTDNIHCLMIGGVALPGITHTPLPPFTRDLSFEGGLHLGTAMWSFSSTTLPQLNNKEG